MSVRGEASRTVEPDYAVVQANLRAVPAVRAAALADVRGRQDALAASLGSLGATALTASSGEAAITWSFGSIAVHDEYASNKRTGEHQPTGRTEAHASVVVAIRDLGRLAELGEALGSVDRLAIEDVSWHVDAANPAWRAVRADAIRAALAKASDYASALGGTVRSVDQLADSGLLDAPGDVGSRARASRRAVYATAGASGDGAAGTPSFDPVPQQIHAVIEARATADTSPDL